MGLFDRMTSTITSRAARVLAAALVLVLAGCDEMTVVEDVSQREATVVVASLNSKGISAIAERSSNSKGKYSVEVKRRDYTQAVAVLAREQLPHAEELSFSEIVAERGLLPNSREIEALRVDHAIGLELKALLESHPGVLSAAVVARTRGADAASPSVSAIVSSRRGATIDTGELSQLIHRAVPGIESERLFVSVHPPLSEVKGVATQGAYNRDGELMQVPLVPFLLMWRVPDDEYNALALALVSVLVAVGAVGVITGYVLSSAQLGRSRGRSRVPAEPALRASPDRERVRRDLTEV